MDRFQACSREITKWSRTSSCNRKEHNKNKGHHVKMIHLPNKGIANWTLNLFLYKIFLNYKKLHIVYKNLKLFQVKGIQETCYLNAL